MKEQYVLMKFDGKQKLYYVGIDDVNTFYNIPIIKLSAEIDGAKTYDLVEEAEEECSNLNWFGLKVYPVCPRCHKEYDGYPAISREDNKTKICTVCGQDEALEEFNKYYGLIH